MRSPRRRRSGLPPSLLGLSLFLLPLAIPLAIPSIARALPEPVPLAPDGLPETLIAYDIDVTLAPATRTLTGREHIRWKNPSDRPIDRVPVHLYLNAFSHERTTFNTTGFSRGGDFDEILPWDPEPWGWNDLKSVEQRATAGARPVPFSPIRPDDGNPLDDTLVELRLPEPVAPGATLELDITFEARLPYPLARTGGGGDYFFVGQWFPKIAAFETPGVRGAKEPHFAARQFRGLTEFYADFADWDVRITAPSEFMVAATGASDPPSDAGSGAHRYEFKQRAVHDFAFVAGSRLSIETRPYQPPSRTTPIAIHYVVPTGTEQQVARWQKIAERTLDVLGDRVGPYPYATFTLVCPPFWAHETGGMEYPTLVTGAPGDPLLDEWFIRDATEADIVFAHEMAHNYFYGLVASNEQEEAFLDEGFTQFWEDEIATVVYGEGRGGGRIAGRDYDVTERERYLVGRSLSDFREPILKRPAGYFFPGSESLQVYSRPALTIATAQRMFGPAVLDKIFHEYYRRMRFRHPEWADFIAVVKEAAGEPVAAFFTEAFTREEVPDYTVTELKSDTWEPPLGRVSTDKGPVIVDDKIKDEQPELGLDAEAREADGRVLMEITDGGALREGASHTGGVERRLVTPARRDPTPGGKPYESKTFRESRARIEGPAWNHLPVDVEFRFADGVVLRDAWDGQSAHREYRFVRRAPLEQVRVDPDGKILVDPKPENNARARTPDKRFALDWSAYVGSVVAWMEGGLSLWL